VRKVLDAFGALGRYRGMRLIRIRFLKAGLEDASRKGICMYFNV